MAALESITYLFWGPSSDALAAGQVIDEVDEDSWEKQDPSAKHLWKTEYQRLNRSSESGPHAGPHPTRMKRKEVV